MLDVIADTARVIRRAETARHEAETRQRAAARIALACRVSPDRVALAMDGLEPGD
jgi:hypothetical protein